MESIYFDESQFFCMERALAQLIGWNFSDFFHYGESCQYVIFILILIHLDVKPPCKQKESGCWKLLAVGWGDVY